MGKPTIRFEGYTDDWEQRKFGEIVEKYEDPVETPILKNSCCKIYLYKK